MDKQPMGKQPSSKQPSDTRLPTMLRKFVKTDGCTWEPPSDPKDFPAWNAFRKEPCFFYGTLMDPSVLAKVLKLRDPPTLVPANIVGYKCKRWGQYPALGDDLNGSVVEGKAYLVQTLTQRKRLEAYETDHYKIAPCLIKMQDGEEVVGNTFVWAGDEAELKEGDFDLKDWQMNRMETRWKGS